MGGGISCQFHHGRRRHKLFSRSQCFVGAGKKQREERNKNCLHRTDVIYLAAASDLRSGTGAEKEGFPAPPLGVGRHLSNIGAVFG